MRRFGGMVGALAIVVICATAPACRGLTGTSAPKVAIPETYRTSSRTYTLLYSTLGYESAATKRVLIRQNDSGAQVSQGLAFEWRLVDDKGAQAAVGHAAFAGMAWGIPFWVADFSNVTKTGDYRLLVESPGVQLATEAFRIDEFALFKATYDAIALDDAEARAAPIEQDNGYFDGNERSGSVTAHADYLVGLVEAFDRRRNSLSDSERTRTRAAIDRAVDYLLLLDDPGTGETAAQSGTRPHADFGPEATASATRALAHFAALAQRGEPDKADRAFRRVKLSEKWLIANAPDAYPPALRAAVDYDLYRFGGDPDALDRASKAVREEVATYDLRTMDRRSNDTLPHFEAMYRLWRDQPTHADHALWEDAAKKAAAQYKTVIDSSVFQIPPPGVTDLPASTTAQEQWDNMASAPLPGEGADGIVGNGWFMARAIDATYLALITKDKALEKTATAGVAWLTGLNPGVGADRVRGSGSGSPYEAASFVTGLNGRAAETWSLWEWPRVKPFATIANGFRAGFVFDDSAASGGTSIGLDGVWLYAAAAYEDFVNPGHRPPVGASQKPQSNAGAFASISIPEASGATLSVLVAVLGPDKSALIGAKVTIAFVGAPKRDASPDDAVRTAQCVTAVGGTCTASLPADALQAQRPITASVTNIEHPQFGYDLSRPVASVQFP